MAKELIRQLLFIVVWHMCGAMKKHPEVYARFLEDLGVWQMRRGIRQANTKRAMKALFFGYSEFRSLLYYRMGRCGVRKGILPVLLPGTVNLFITCPDVGGGFLLSMVFPPS